ncbi:hypothetical protein M5689_010241 [Euphorbia peplus]|nr:hypothetical protein M5689_010241 [Euphorbia peplus]
MDKILSTFKNPSGDESGKTTCAATHKDAMDVLHKSIKSLETGEYKVIKSGLETIAGDSDACDYTLGATVIIPFLSKVSHSLGIV